MAGFGSGVGASDFAGSMQKGRDNALKNRQTSLMEEEQRRQQELEAQGAQVAKSSGANTQALQDEIKANTENTRKMSNKNNGNMAKAAIARAATSAGSSEAGGDLVNALNNSEEIQQATNQPKNSYTAFDSTSKAHNDAFLKMLGQKGTDYSQWSPEFMQEVKDTFADSGLDYINADGAMVDISKDVTKMGALKGAPKSGVNVFEGKKANRDAMTQGEAGYSAWVKDMLDDPNKKTFLRDYADKLPKSQQDKLLARKTEISGQTHEQNMSDIDKMQADLDEEGFGADSVAPKDPNGQGLPETEVQDLGVKPEDTITQPATMEKNEDGTEAGKGMITQADGTKVDVSVNKDKNGNTKAKGTDGSSATVQKDGAGVFKSPDGNVTTVGSDGQSVTVAPDGKVTSNEYVLPKSVQMAYDMMGMESQFSEKNVLARKKAQHDMDKPDSAMGKYVSDFVEMGLGTEEDGLTAYNASKSLTGKNRAPTYVEEFRKSSKWLADNPDKKGTAEYNQHRTVQSRFGNELRTAEMKNNEATSSTIMEKYGLVMTDMYEPNGKVSGNGLAIDAKIRGNKDIYTKEVKKRESEAYDTAQSVANLTDLGIKIEKGVADGTYKSGYIDSAANWAQTKAGSDFIYDATSGEIGAKLETQLGIEGELAIELGRVVKAAYGGNASNTDRETIAGAMSGMTSDDEAVRKKSFDNFQRTMKKLNAQNMQHFKEEGLHKTVDRLNDTANTRFDSQGNINEGKTSSKRSEVKKGTRAQFEAKEKGVTFYKGGKPYHFNKNGQLANGAA